MVPTGEMAVGTCFDEKSSLGGTQTIPEPVVEDRLPYYQALEAADGRYAEDQALTGGLLNEWKS